MCWQYHSWPCFSSHRSKSFPDLELALCGSCVYVLLERSNKTRPSCLLEAFSPEDVDFFFHPRSMVAPTFPNEKNKDTETIKDFSESQSEI